jgi:hypothetical protein
LAVVHEFISAWRSFDTSGSGPFFLPGDEELLALDSPRQVLRSEDEYGRALADGQDLGTAFHLGLLPQPFHGPVASADVYLLALNPSFRHEDYAAERPGSPFRGALVAGYSGTAPMTFLDAAHELHPGFHWWTRDASLDRVAAALAAERAMSLGDARRFMAGHIAAIQVAPYHSARFARTGLVDRLRSIVLARRFVSEFVLPRAEAGQCGVVLMWGPWGLQPKEPNVVVQGGISGKRLGPNTRGGQLILRWLRRRLELSSHRRDGDELS